MAGKEPRTLARIFAQLHENLQSEMSIDAEKLRHNLDELGEAWALAKADYEEKDDLTKTILADIATNFMPHSKSKTEAEMMALRHADFKTHLAEVSKCRRTWLLSQVKYENLKTYTELCRSQESTERSKMNLR